MKQTKSEIQLTENKVSRFLAAAWNSFIKLKSTHPDHTAYFRGAIHQCHEIIMWRELQRLKPKKYPTEKEKT